MKTVEIQDLIDADSKIDENKLDWEIERIPSLHAKYYRIYMDELSSLRRATAAFHDIKKKRSEYYLGRASDEAYRKEPLNIKVIKTELDLYLNADPMYIEASDLFDSQKSKVVMLEKFIASLKDRAYSLRTALDFKKFTSGAY